VPTHRFVVVDVFTDTALAGNQLAVFTDARGIEAETMQALALEVGFSETTFVLPPEAGGIARVRIFNPDHEMQFAGHPVLGTAWVLAQPLQRGVVELETGSGIVPVEIDRDESGALVFGRMQQPIPTIEPVTDERLASCPFCEGREDRTPPELLALPRDRAPDTPGWVRSDVSSWS